MLRLWDLPVSRIGGRTELIPLYPFPPLLSVMGVVMCAIFTWPMGWSWAAWLRVVRAAHVVFIASLRIRLARWMGMRLRRVNTCD